MALNRSLRRSNHFLALLHNLGVQSSEAAEIWKRIEHSSPTFCGVEALPLSTLVNAADKPLWERKLIFFWTFRGAEGGSGSGAAPLVEVEQTSAEAKAIEKAHTYAVADIFARLFLFCTSFDRDRLLLFAFRQLQEAMDPSLLIRWGDEIVTKEVLVAMVTCFHGEVDGPRELEKLLSFGSFDERDCMEFNAFSRLNMICKSLCRPLNETRQLLRRRWLGERFWRKCDRFREKIEGEKLRDFRDLLRGGDFAPTTNEDEPDEDFSSLLENDKDDIDALLAKRRKAQGLSLRALRKNMRSAMAGKHRNGSSSGAPSSAVRLMTPMEKRVGGRSGAFSNSGDLWTEPHLIQRLSKKKTRNGHLEQQQSNKHGKMPPPPKAVYEVEIDTATELLRESHLVHTARSMLVKGSRK